MSPQKKAWHAPWEIATARFDSADPLAHYAQLLETRRPLYAEVADLKVRTGVRSPQQVVGDILSFLESL